MFTGIVKGLFPVSHASKKGNLLNYSIAFTDELLKDLQIGASVSVDGTCQTVVRVEGSHVWFDAIPETLQKTTLKFLTPGQKVNIERAARFGDEIGGHLLSGHVFGTAQISQIVQKEHLYAVHIQCPAEWMKYILPKGFIALDGASLTIVDTYPSGEFTVHLIPETIRQTTFGYKKEGDPLNLELDAQTQAIVDTVERIMAAKN